MLLFVLFRFHPILCNTMLEVALAGKTAASDGAYAVAVDRPFGPVLECGLVHACAQTKGARVPDWLWGIEPFELALLLGAVDLCRQRLPTTASGTADDLLDEAPAEDETADLHMIEARLVLLCALWGHEASVRRLPDLAHAMHCTDDMRWADCPLALYRDYARWCAPLALAHSERLCFGNDAPSAGELLRPYMRTLADAALWTDPWYAKDACENGPRCVVCLCEAPVMVLEPCGHMCLCRADWSTMVRKRPNGRAPCCPLCRRAVDVAWGTKPLDAQWVPALPSAAESGDDNTDDDNDDDGANAVDHRARSDMIWDEMPELIDMSDSDESDDDDDDDDAEETHGYGDNYQGASVVEPQTRGTHYILHDYVSLYPSIMSAHSHNLRTLPRDLPSLDSDSDSYGRPNDDSTSGVDSGLEGIGMAPMAEGISARAQSLVAQARRIADAMHTSVMEPREPARLRTARDPWHNFAQEGQMPRAESHVRVRHIRSRQALSGQLDGSDGLAIQPSSDGTVTRADRLRTTPTELAGGRPRELGGDLDGNADSRIDDRLEDAEMAPPTAAYRVRAPRPVPSWLHDLVEHMHTSMAESDEHDSYSTWEQTVHNHWRDFVQQRQTPGADSDVQVPHTHSRQTPSVLHGRSDSLFIQASPDGIVTRADAQHTVPTDSTGSRLHGLGIDGSSDPSDDGDDSKKEKKEDQTHISQSAVSLASTQLTDDPRLAAATTRRHLSPLARRFMAFYPPLPATLSVRDRVPLGASRCLETTRPLDDRAAAGATPPPDEQRSDHDVPTRMYFEIDHTEAVVAIVRSTPFSRLGISHEIEVPVTLQHIVRNVMLKAAASLPLKMADNIVCALAWALCGLRMPADLVHHGAVVCIDPLSTVHSDIECVRAAAARQSFRHDGRARLPPPACVAESNVKRLRERARVERPIALLALYERDDDLARALRGLGVFAP